ncbi:NADPH-dependent ferric siderophore reductase [Methylopila jiangsuensis]|uniref:NADPH-dependent ferric siderophore reductase n=1 Tax=Methylopila jiangsuensis TaxID=586230 RepID=A0A9W6JJA2_9HYPH|nr:siderophore-interacting protein [Methylopila jiangsuensis]MDR6285189.1 NADPH-dependent ferric siderophore reductase [Methylopila jiangsuensis]GLK77421.1 NADPH-dependent ferric siderophore reductase [Methylopila jiangsuensis]
MTKLLTEAEIALAEPERIAELVCAHLTEHGATAGRDAEGWTLTWPRATARMSAAAGRLRIHAEAEDFEALYWLRLGLASHVAEFAGAAAPTILWSGDGNDILTPPNFRLARVAGVTQITPNMRRVTLTGDDLARFMTDDALHVKLLAPTVPGRPAGVPTIGRDGVVVWPQGEGAPARRTYTVRRFDRARQTLDIDVVAHDAPGPGARWALSARAGDEIGVMGPGGGGIPQAAELLIAGDETALPAIARILEALPRAARGRAIVEVADVDEIQPIAAPDGVELVWRDRSAPQAPAGETLADAVARAAPARPQDDVFLWAGCEFEDFRAIRAHARKTLGLPKARHLVAAYWRRGRSESAREE